MSVRAGGRLPAPGAALLLTTGLAICLAAVVGALPRPTLPHLTPATTPVVVGSATGKDAEPPQVRMAAASAHDARPPAQVPGPVDLADPVRIRIPAIGVAAAMIPLGTDDAGELEVPVDPAEAGWWRGGPEPGEPGAAVVVGHVDSWRGPAVFFDLADLRRGDRIQVDLADGTQVEFRVRSSMAVDKGAFPTQAVYGATPDPQLRLVTCHGDLVGGSYEGNLVILADLVA